MAHLTLRHHGAISCSNLYWKFRYSSRISELKGHDPSTNFNHQEWPQDYILWVNFHQSRHFDRVDQFSRLRWRCTLSFRFDHRSVHSVQNSQMFYLFMSWSSAFVDRQSSRICPVHRHSIFCIGFRHWSRCYRENS